MTIITRRSFLGGLLAAAAAPAIVRASSLMPVRALAPPPLVWTPAYYGDQSMIIMLHPDIAAEIAGDISAPEGPYQVVSSEVGRLDAGFRFWSPR